MSVVRLVHTSDQDSLQAVGQVVKDGTQPVILVDFIRPYHDLKQRLDDAGVDTGGVYFVDSTGHVSMEAFREDAFFIGSPTQLERIALVCRKVLPRLGGCARIIIHDHGTMVQYNGPNASKEFVHFLANQSRNNGCPMDIMTTDGAADLTSFVDETVQLGAAP